MYSYALFFHTYGKWSFKKSNDNFACNAIGLSGRMFLPRIFNDPVLISTIISIPITAGFLIATIIMAKIFFKHK